jgi:hypothetical protein
VEAARLAPLDRLHAHGVVDQLQEPLGLRRATTWSRLKSGPTARSRRRRPAVSIRRTWVRSRVTSLRPRSSRRAPRRPVQQVRRPVAAEHRRGRSVADCIWKFAGFSMRALSRRQWRLSSSVSGLSSLVNCAHDARTRGPNADMATVVPNPSTVWTRALQRSSAKFRPQVGRKSMAPAGAADSRCVGVEQSEPPDRPRRAPPAPATATPRSRRSRFLPPAGRTMSSPRSPRSSRPSSTPARPTTWRTRPGAPTWRRPSASTRPRRC